MKHYSLLILTITLLLCGCQKEKPIVTLGSLLEEMTDRDNLSRYPEPYYVCKQFSSYDRATVAPGDMSWFANWDRSMFIRIESKGEKKEYVMMDTEGPGAIVRFWMTFTGENSGEGILRIYLDNNPVPAVEGAAFDIISRGGIVGAPLSSSVSDSTKYEMRGHNLYFPIPYATHCKVTYESENIKDAGAKTGGEAVYYNINYRTYIQGTEVVTFSAEEKAKYNATIEETQEKLKNREFTIPGIKTEKYMSGTISAGSFLKEELNGKSAIRSLRFKLEAKNLEQALRSTILEISFDGKTTVKSPIGDFFGTGYRIREYNSWYAKVENDGTMSCFWVMPFKDNCVINIVNNGKEDVKIVKGEIVSSPYGWDKNTMYFGAAWRQYTNLETGEMKNNEGDGGPFDINYVTIKGKGVYVGDGITLFNTVYAWWGEGDEKVYVDGESFPSHIGTGTEDYYGYAWCRPEKFISHPFIAQPDGSGNFVPGYTVNLRFRSLDAIPFKESIKFDMEMWHWTKATINFAPVTFWYVHPDNVEQDVYELKDSTEPVALDRKDIISSAIKDNKIEFENMNLESNTGRQFRNQNNVNNGWSNNVQMVWTMANTGDKLELSFTSDTEKITDATIFFSKSRNYGRYSISINGGPPATISGTGEKFSIGEYTMKNIKLLKGENLLTITGLPTDKKLYLVGVDCIVFK